MSPPRMMSGHSRLGTGGVEEEWLMVRLAGKCSLEFELAVDSMKPDYLSVRLAEFRESIETLVKMFYPRKPMAVVFFVARLFVELEFQPEPFESYRQKLQHLAGIFESRPADGPTVDAYLRTFGILLVLYPRLHLLQVTAGEWNGIASGVNWTEVIARDDKFWKESDFPKPSARLAEAAQEIFGAVIEAHKHLVAGRRNEDMCHVVLGELRVNLKLRGSLAVGQGAEVKQPESSRSRTASAGSKDGGKQEVAELRSKEGAKVGKGKNVVDVKIAVKKEKEKGEEGVEERPKNLVGEESPKQEASSPKENVKSSKKEASIPMKEANCPKKDASSTKKDDTNPKKDATIPKKDATSPKKDATSPKKDATSPKKDATSPKKDATSAKKDATSAKKDATSPKKDATSHKKDATSPKKDATSPKKDASSPTKDDSSTKKDTSRPKKDASSPKKDAISPKRDASSTTNPKKDATSPTKDASSPKKDGTIPKKDASSTKKDATNPKKDASPKCRGPCCVHLQEYLRKYLRHSEISQHRRLIEQICEELLPRVRWQLEVELDREIRLEMAQAVYTDIVEGRRPLTAAMRASIKQHYEKAGRCVQRDLFSDWLENHSAEYYSRRRQALDYRLQRIVRSAVDGRLIAQAGAFPRALNDSKELRKVIGDLNGEFNARLRESIREGLAMNIRSVWQVLKEKQDFQRKQF